MGRTQFQSTRPIRGATRTSPQRKPRLPRFQSTRPIRGATRSAGRFRGVDRHFNPRAPYGARLCQLPHSVVTDAISIHAPHTGRDTAPSKIRNLRNAFQSTRPIRGATLRPGRKGTGKINFNPRAPYGARQQKCIIYVLHFCNNRQSKHKNQQETSSVRTFF